MPYELNIKITAENPAHFLKELLSITKLVALGVMSSAGRIGCMSWSMDITKDGKTVTHGLTAKERSTAMLQYSNKMLEETERLGLSKFFQFSKE